jgi:hypothetical protein
MKFIVNLILFQKFKSCFRWICIYICNNCLLLSSNVHFYFKCFILERIGSYFLRIYSRFLWIWYRGGSKCIFIWLEYKIFLMFFEFNFIFSFIFFLIFIFFNRVLMKKIPLIRILSLLFSIPCSQRTKSIFIWRNLWLKRCLLF